MQNPGQKLGSLPQWENMLTFFFLKQQHVHKMCGMRKQAH